MPTIDRKRLSENLNIDFDDKMCDSKFETIENDAKDISIKKGSSEDLLRDNIDRANRILDSVELELSSGNISPRMFEVAGLLINAVSTAVAQLNISEFNKSGLLLKERMIELNRMKIEAEVRDGKIKSITNQQNIIVTDRETILKMLDEPTKELPPERLICTNQEDVIDA